MKPFPPDRNQLRQPRIQRCFRLIFSTRSHLPTGTAFSVARPCFFPSRAEPGTRSHRPGRSLPPAISCNNRMFNDIASPHFPCATVHQRKQVFCCALHPLPARMASARPPICYVRPISFPSACGRSWRPPIPVTLRAFSPQSIGQMRRSRDASGRSGALHGRELSSLGMR